MRTSEAIDAICAALAMAQGEMKPAVKDATNPHFKSKYADLATVRNAVMPTLSAHNLSVVQLPTEIESGPALTTILLHASGEWIKTTMLLRPTKGDPQGIGSALTYARRYALQSVAGVAADDDDDGGHAANAPPVQRHHQQRAEQPPTTNGHATMPKAEPTTADKLASIVKWIKNGRDQFTAGNFAEQVAKLDQRFVALAEGYTVGNAERAVLANLFDEARLEELMESDVQTAWETLRDFAATLTAKATVAA